MKDNNYQSIVQTVFLGIGFTLFAGVAFAADATPGMGGTGMQWETALRTISQSLSGPVAYAIALFSVVGAIARLVLSGGEVSDTFRIVLFLIMGLCVLMFVNRFLTSTMFSGAVIP